MASPELRGTWVEYQGPPVPLVRPNPLGIRIEHVSDPFPDGILINGRVTQLFSKASDTDVVLTSRLPISAIEALPRVVASPAFANSATWEQILVQYLNRANGDIMNIIHRRAGPNFDGALFIPSTFDVGFLDKRSVIVRNNGGAELILLPVDFVDGESLVLVA